MNKDWTPLPAKWSPSTILKLHDRLLSKFLRDILIANHGNLTQNEKNKRIGNCVKWVELIRNYTMSGQMTYKKDAEKEEKKKNEM